MNFTPKNIEDIIAESITVKTRLMESCMDEIRMCGEALIESLAGGGKLFLCGNGGSAADSQHIAAELVVRFRSSVNRPALPALALTVDPSIATAGGNDIGFENVFARQVEAFGKSGDALIGISTSGNSTNVGRAMKKARELGVRTIGLLGCKGGSLLGLSDASVVVPSDVTARVQESHILIGHIWCEMIEAALFPEIVEAIPGKKISL